MHYSV